MTHTISATEHVPRTDTKVLPFVVRDDSGSRVDITHATITWELRKKSTYPPALSLTDAGVSVVNRVGEQGEFAIRLETDATADLDPQVYRERVRVTFTDGDQTTWIGEVPIVEDA